MMRIMSKRTTGTNAPGGRYYSASQADRGAKKFGTTLPDDVLVEIGHLSGPTEDGNKAAAVSAAIRLYAAIGPAARAALRSGDEAVLERIRRAAEKGST